MPPIYFSVSGLIAWYLQKWLVWTWLRLPAFLVLAVIPIVAIAIISGNLNPLGNFGWLGWLITFFVIYHLLYEHEKKPTHYLVILHAGAALMLWLFLHLENHYLVKHITWLSLNYQIFSFLLPPVVLLWGSLGLQKLKKWPVNRDKHTYPFYINGILSISIAYLLIILNLSQAGDLTLLPYMPLLNALDISILLCLGAMTCWLQNLSRLNLREQSHNKFLLAILILEYFIWFNSMLARSMHHWFNIPYNFSALFNSIIVQAAYSIYWGILALICILFAKYKQSRLLWLTGTWLMGIVVLKLFIIDLAHSDTLERIISFVMIGVILLLIGYFSPIPPKVKLPG